ncbi:MAG: zf-HC2 domain-containing protein [Verrucomicrobia bacterium]|nr:zf-HC2 domain-containing protein [Verrucomicrobiota bacterium]MCG2679783.1 zf-HC2 domain-containing protein [Kiritimatiellia bacterium]MBU4247102.1 zf-HC2 domain-containing protein [Verrucomicrobiota bacterium]MBU4289988.1 zf-HC2 domain-containing protein [Verrucomicrobiota bacterium]MBU4428651.1 zf-HC2 domain-containing protein [Verrucomicrobiota bacterium]
MMNCRQAEQRLLLKDSGELPFQDRLRLEQHLAACRHCCVYRDDVERVTSLARQGLPAGEPGGRALAAIREAARFGGSPKAVTGWEWCRDLTVAMVRPALAVAAVVMLCLGGWYWLAGSGPAPTGLVAASKQPAIEVASQSGEGFDDLTRMLVEDVVIIEGISELSARSDISPLDRDLLLLEGLAI